MHTTVTIRGLPAPQAHTCYELARRLGHRWAVAAADGEIPAEHASLHALREAVQALPAWESHPGIDGPDDSGADGEVSHQSGRGSIRYRIDRDGALRAWIHPAYDAGWAKDMGGVPRPILHLSRSFGGRLRIEPTPYTEGTTGDDLVSAVASAAHLVGWTGDRVAESVWDEAAKNGCGRRGPVWSAWARHQAAWWAEEVQALDRPATSRWEEPPVHDVEIIARRTSAP